MEERKTIKRRFSLEGDFMNYHVDDILYAYLQTLATTTKGDNKKTYLSKRNYELNRKGIYVACNLNSRSLKARMEMFINNGLIVEEDINTDSKKQFLLLYSQKKVDCIN